MRKVSLFLPVILVLSVVSSAWAQTAVNESPAAEKFMDEFIKGAASEANVPGAMVAIVRNGRLVLLKGYGDAHLRDGKKVDPESTYFRVGSISKTFVALGILQLIQENKIQLDQNVSEILPDLASGFKYPVTIRQLVTHTAGFDERLIGLGASPDEALPPVSQIVIDQYPGQIAEPGSYYNYSNYGFLVLAAILEVKSGQSFMDYQNEHVLAPLGLKATFSPEDLDQERISASYVMGPDGQRVEMAPMRLRYFPVGSLYATGQDMARYLTSLINGFNDNGALSDDSYGILVQNLYRPAPELPGSAFSFYERDLRGLRMLEHGGDWEAFSSLISFSPEDRSGIFFSSNGSTDPLLREKLMQSFADYLGLKKPAQAPTQKPGLELDAYAGSYRYARYEHDGLLKVGGLPMQVDVEVDGDGLNASFPADFRQPIALRPVGEHIFQSQDPELKIVFAVEDGKAVGISGTYMVPFYLERISPLEGMQTVVPLTAFAVIMMLGCLFAPVARKLYIRFTGNEPPELEPDAQEEERKIFRLMVATAWAHVLFLLGTQIHMAILQQQIVEGVPRSLEAILYLPYGLLLLTVLLAIRIPRVWNAFSWGTGLKIFYTLVATAGVIFFQLLWYWNLLAPVRG
ncbi:MAG TPA: hypothetical protein DEA96_12850 [Leptospiraceae bacterium]|mgnify:CR=1 FL=1|nr:hypothetical protein [Spirochaetaceae bacterium]HBS05851.1 hypothetical protein [Leptospiraceae bacterium]|tara:strand:+ start:154262 stop:156151 length:1890 start_codon:yes stop_codon:yes gene_type:complete